MQGGMSRGARHTAPDADTCQETRRCWSCAVGAKHLARCNALPRASGKRAATTGLHGALSRFAVRMHPREASPKLYTAAWQHPLPRPKVCIGRVRTQVLVCCIPPLLSSDWAPQGKVHDGRCQLSEQRSTRVHVLCKLEMFPQGVRTRALLSPGLKSSQELSRHASLVCRIRLMSVAFSLRVSMLPASIDANIDTTGRHAFRSPFAPITSSPRNFVVPQATQLPLQRTVEAKVCSLFLRSVKFAAERSYAQRAHVLRSMTSDLCGFAARVHAAALSIPDVTSHQHIARDALESS